MNAARLLATGRDRLYSDFVMPSRLEAYRHLLETALRAGYGVLSIETYWQLLLHDKVDQTKRYLVLRHDIDTDRDTARLMWEIERSLGIKSSYFFRLGTLDLKLMGAIAQESGHASYHYEELATVAKRRRPRDAEAAMRLIPEAQDLFRHNLQKLRIRTGLSMNIVASHGDFLNRKLGVNNWAIVSDVGFRAAIGITLETYDQAFLRTVTSHQWDTHYPQFWIQGDPNEAIQRRDPVVYLLVHPRHWRINRRENARDDLARLREGLAYQFAPSRTRRST